MVSHANAIIDKMSGAEYPDLSFEFVYKLTNESERGAVLIGTSKVEIYLERLIERVLPSKQKKYKDRLFNYPGPLSSFSGKIELAYAFRIIDEKLYKSLNKLREIRNLAAHSSDSFFLKKHREKLDIIYSFEVGFNIVVHELAHENLIKWEKININDILVEKNLLDYKVETLWSEIILNPEINDSIGEQLIIWELAFGLTFLCLKIQVVIDEYTFDYGSMLTWNDILGRRNE